MKPIRLGKRDSIRLNAAAVIEPTVSQQESITTSAAESEAEHKNNDPPILDPACPICQIDVGKKSPEGIKESWAQTPCGHVFGNVCLKRYLALMVLEKPTCPVCRQNIHHVCGHPALPMPYTGSPAATTSNTSTTIPIARRQSRQGRLVKRVPLAERGRQYYWGTTTGVPDTVPCRYCFNQVVAREIAASASHAASLDAEEHDHDEDGLERSSTSQSSDDTAGAPTSAPLQQRKWTQLWRGAYMLVRNRRWRFVRRIVKKRQPQRSARTVQETSDESDEDQVDDGSPPVPGAYGHWELATNEPDWDYMKWFDAQEPKGKTTREDWAR